MALRSSSQRGLLHDGSVSAQFDQVQKPFFDSQEMDLTGEGALADGLRKTAYANTLQTWVGEDARDDDRKLTYHAYQGSPFSSYRRPDR